MKKFEITFNELLEKYQNNYGKDHDEIFYEIVFALSKLVKSKEVFIALRAKPIDFKLKHYGKMIEDYYKHQMPLAHVVGSAKFMGLRFNVSKKVLAPRDITEQMVKDFITVHKANSFHDVLDLCSGSGCIGVSIKKFIPQFNVTCIDKYWSALFDTVMNAKQNNTPITADVKDAIEYLNSKPSIDILISNPPYIDADNFDNKKMFKHESKKALIADENGLFFIKRYLEYLNTHPFNEAWIEYGYDQRQVLADLSKAYSNIKVDIPSDKQYMVVKPIK